MGQIEQIRQELPDSTIIAIMSGNIVQRGEFAMLDKYFRAKIALECGANAVFELPYPYCGSTAEVFANAGVEIAHKLGCDYLYFGTEEQEIEKIERIAELIDSSEFENKLKEQIDQNEGSYLEAKSKALESFGFSLPNSSNDILALEYIRAIKNKNVPLKYKTIKRVGARYNDRLVCDIMSATAIRRYFYENGGFLSVPCEELYACEADAGNILDKENSNRFLHRYVIQNGCKIKEAFDSNEEIESLLTSLAMKSVSYDFFTKLSSKKYTTSRLKRVLLYSLFDIKSVDFSPKFTFLLAMDNKGQQALSRVKKTKDFKVITKHSDVKKLDEASAVLAEKRYEIDTLYNTLLRTEKVPDSSYKQKPILQDSK